MQKGIKGVAAWVKRPAVRRIFWGIVDVALACLAFQTAVLLRFEGTVTPRISRILHERAVYIIGIQMLLLIVCGHYFIYWRCAGAREVFRVGCACAAGAGVTIVVGLAFQWGLPRSVCLLTSMCTFLLTTASRYMGRTVYADVRRWRRNHGAVSSRRILIVGAGEGGLYLARFCRDGHESQGTVVGFVDSDPNKQRLRLDGIPVLGTVEHLPSIVNTRKITDIIIAIPSLKGDALNQIVEACTRTGCRTRIFSEPGEWEKPRVRVRELNTSDFLSRTEVQLDEVQIRGYLTDQVVLVTGGGGSIGSEICRQVMRFSPKKLLIFDIYENCAYELLCELRHIYGGDCPAEVLIGSIRDKARLDAIFETYHPSVVFHAAAHKHVPLMETSPAEAVKNNVFGTRNLLQSASEHGVARLVQLSTDKAVNPTNVMGATKRITEMLIQQFAAHSAMKCMAVRFGNVLGSHGSVIPLFEKQIRTGGPVTLTHPDITRYFMTIPEAAQLVLQAGGQAQSGSIYVLDMGEPVKIIDLARKLIRFYGYEPDVDIPIQMIGLREGEKLYEELMMDGEKSGMTRTAHDKIFVAPPISIDESQFEVQLERLRIVADQGNTDGVLQQLMATVTTYAPNRAQIGA